MNKAEYFSPEFSVTRFSDSEVITASSSGFVPDEEDKPIELPFVPIGK